VVSLEGHAAVALELPARGGWIDSHLRQLRVAVAPTRLTLHGNQQPGHEGRRLAAVIQRPALHAGAVARMEGVRGRAEELDVLALRRACAARRAAEDSRRA